MTRCPACRTAITDDDADQRCSSCQFDLTAARAEYARLRQPSLTWTGRNAIPIGPFRDLTRAARRALAKVWWSR